MYQAVIIGAGFSGIALGIKLKEKNIHNFIILEKAKELGGTWRENTYPGAKCDIPSALYSYSFEPNPNWQYKWSHQSQILEYIKHCAKKYNLLSHIVYNKELMAATWQETAYYWEITTKDGSQYKSKTLIHAIGQLHHPSIPAFKGKDDFEGASWHSATWNHKVRLEDKNIGVIGNAASALQLIPEIAKVAKNVSIFQRTANWVLAKNDRAYKAWERKLFKLFPITLKLLRLLNWLQFDFFYYKIIEGHTVWARKLVEKQATNFMKKFIKSPEMQQALTPKYPIGAKRALVSDNYYQALNRQNVKLITESIEQITGKGILTKDKNQHDFDIIIYATGFISNPFLLGLDIKGLRGKSIQEAWKTGSKNYLGISVNDFPNMFLMYGPNTNLGSNSIIYMIECQANYITQCLSAMKKNDWKIMEVKKEVLNNYYQSIQKRLRNTVWAKIDDSWYKSESGNIPNNWPGRTIEYARLTKKVNYADFNIL